MNEFLTKLSSYNLFNYLLPGVLFAALGTEVVHYQLIQKDIVTGFFLYYFFGLVVSRFGSLLLEPLLKRLSFVHFANYSDFVAASNKDPQVNVLSESNNTYRTLCSLFGLLLLLKLYETIEWRVPSLVPRRSILVIALLFILFLFSYRKQTAYITKRVKADASNLPRATSAVSGRD